MNPAAFRRNPAQFVDVMLRTGGEARTKFAAVPSWPLLSNEHRRSQLRLVTLLPASLVSAPL